MSEQDLINVLIGLVLTGFGWFLNNIWAAVKTLQDSDARLAKDMASIQILVAGHYVSKPELESLTRALFKKLDKIEDKLDHKVDK